MLCNHGYEGQPAPAILTTSMKEIAESQLQLVLAVIPFPRQATARGMQSPILPLPALQSSRRCLSRERVYSRGKLQLRNSHLLHCYCWMGRSRRGTGWISQLYIVSLREIKVYPVQPTGGLWDTQNAQIKKNSIHTIL